MNDKRKNPRPEGKKCLSDRIVIQAAERMINKIKVEAMRRPAIEEIHDSLVNGQRKQMVNQINEYGLYDFFADYLSYLRAICDNTGAFEDCVISYHRISNR